MPKIAQSTPMTDTQRHVLAAALLRTDGALTLRDVVKGNAASAKVGQALLGKALVREIRAKAELPVWRRDVESGRSFSLVLTKAGRTSAAQNTDVAASLAGPPPEAPAIIAPAPGMVAPGEDGSASAPGRRSKIAEVIALLRRNQGSSVTELMAITGWLPHTTRAALTGLRKRGYTVMRETTADGSVYRITEVAAAAA